MRAFVLLAVVTAVVATTGRARAQAVHLDRLNVDVDLGPGWTVDRDPDADAVIAPNGSALGWKILDSCKWPAQAKPLPAGLTCPADFECRGDTPDSGLMMVGRQSLGDIGCLQFTFFTLPAKLAETPIADIVKTVHDLVVAGHVATIDAELLNRKAKFNIRTGATAVEWHWKLLPHDDPDARGYTFLYADGAPERTGIAVTSHVGPCPDAITNGEIWPYPTVVVAGTDHSRTLCTKDRTGNTWMIVVLLAPDANAVEARHWMVPAVVGVLDELELVLTRPSAITSEPDHGATDSPAARSGVQDDDAPHARVYLAGARVSPEIDDAGSFGALRVGLDLVAPVSDAAVAPAVSFGTALGMDSAFRLAADIYLGFGLSASVGGLQLSATAVAGADRSGPDSSFTFGGRGYLGATGDVRIPLTVAAIDLDTMWNTKEKRLSASVVPRGLPLGAGLLLHAYDQSTAVMLFVALTKPYGEMR